MFKGSVEWEYKPGDEFVLRFKHPPDLPGKSGKAKAVGKEFMISIRDLLNAAIARAESEERQQPAGRPRTSRTTKTKIQVE
jgi:hypothetical protein